MKHSPEEMANDLRSICAADIWRGSDRIERNLPVAIRAAQRRLMEIADELSPVRREAPKGREFSPAERKAYGELKRAERERHQPTGDPRPKKVRTPHLYRTNRTAP